MTGRRGQDQQWPGPHSPVRPDRRSGPVRGGPHGGPRRDRTTGPWSAPGDTSIGIAATPVTTLRSWRADAARRSARPGRRPLRRGWRARRLRSRRSRCRCRVAAGHHISLDVGHQLPDLRRGRLIQPPAAHCSTTRFQYDPYARRVSALTAADTTGTYSAKVGTGLQGCGTAARSAGDRPSAPAAPAPPPRPVAGRRPRSWPPPLARDGGVRPHHLVHYREGVRGQRVLGGEDGQQHPVSGA